MKNRNPTSVKLEHYSSEDEYLRNSALTLARLLHSAKADFNRVGNAELADRVGRCCDVLIDRYGLMPNELQSDMGALC